jgi:hypothetical protein
MISIYWVTVHPNRGETALKVFEVKSARCLSRI